MGQNKKNQAAKELWGQVFSRLSAQHNASMWNENYDGNADELRMRQGFREAGWSDTVVDSLLHFQEQAISRATRTSPGVNPYAEFFFDTLSIEVESAMGASILISLWLEELSQGLDRSRQISM
jgi:alkyl sulfatase BDS1-like metallo-beta-lactamase superfamily hydrolase